MYLYQIKDGFVPTFLPPSRFSSIRACASAPMLASAAMPIAPATVVPRLPPAMVALGLAPVSPAAAASPGVANPVEERRFRILSATEPGGEEGVIGVMAADTVTVGSGPGGIAGVVEVDAMADMVLRRFRMVSAIAPGEEGVMGWWLDWRLAEAGGAAGGADGGPEAAVADMSLEKWTIKAVFDCYVSHRTNF